MKKIACALGFAALAALATIAMTAGEASAADACYSWSAFPSSPLRLDIKFFSGLSIAEEEIKFQHPKQGVDSIQGKGVNPCVDALMATATGTMVRATPGAGNSTNTGAHMGIRVHSVRGSPTFCREYTLDCTTSEVVAPPNVPTTWSCFSRNEFNIDHGPSTLTLVNPATNPLCSIFEDGSFVDGSASAAAALGSGPYPGSGP